MPHDCAIAQSVAKAELEASRASPSKCPQSRPFTWNADTNRATGAQQNPCSGDNIWQVAHMLECRYRDDPVVSRCQGDLADIRERGPQTTQLVATLVQKGHGFNDVIGPDFWLEIRVVQRSRADFQRSCPWQLFSL